MPRAALDVSADRNADDYRTSPVTIAPPAYRGDLITQFHGSWPEIVGKLNLDDRLVTCNCHSAGYASNTCLRKGRVAYAITKPVSKSASDRKRHRRTEQ